ncbi:D-alanyl-D-alanine carboxypeptidase family protein [Virgibacillus xinjiangensis]|uniref:D-alanyl-D-alanine carboxypeptidase family protein n=1 Tax=Virgibacillus xinjiangensis TaxID=393090 RepID=A0ABV7CRD6_9BACI
MKRIIALLCILCCFLIHPTYGQAAPSVSANNAVLIEQSTGRVLYEKQAHEKELIASITKIMTAIIAVESGKMNETATISRKAVYTEGSSIYLEEGEKMRIEDLVYGLMLRSGNDAAVAIAEHIGGSEEGFVHLMNEKAEWLGMTNSSFANPHGLNADNHYSTAFDMALLMRYAMGHPAFKEITGATSYLSEKRSYSWKNKNKLLTQLYENTTGGKTGFTKKAGRTLVSSAEKDGMTLIAVTLNAPDDWNDHIGLYEWGFEHYELEKILQEGQDLYRLSNSGELHSGYIQEELIYPLADGELEQLDKQTYLLDEQPGKESGKIGKTIYHLNGEPIAERGIYAEQITRSENFAQEVLSVYRQITGGQ